MPPRFDAEHLHLSLSVADLIDTQLLRSLGFANRGGFERLWMGQAIHSRYQEEARTANPAYRAEVGLRHRLDHDGWTVEVVGRLDGLRPEADRLVVEEVKSIRDFSRASPALRQMYARQAQIYAWILGLEQERPVDAELVWIEIASGEVVREPVEIEPQAIERAVRRRLDALLAEFSAQELARAARRQAAADMPFPYPAMRPGQERILEAVEQSVDSEEHLLVEAPTGIGKTVAALYPALRYALAHDKRVLVLTAKNLQQEMITQVLEMLDSERAFHALRLRAKARMCAHTEVLCHEEYCPYARDYFQKLGRSGVVDRLLDEHGVLVPDAVFAAARGAEVCPFEVSLELAGRAQVVVGDYNYAFEPWVALKDFRDEGSLADWILVVDEMHNLVDRGRGYYSPALSAARAGRVAEAIHARDRGEGPAAHLAALAGELARLVERHVDDALEDLSAAQRAAETALPADALWELRPQFDQAFVEHLEYRRETRSFSADDPFVDLYFELLRFLEVLEIADGEAFSHVVERHNGDRRLAILCKDPGKFLGRIFAGAHAVIGLSATLSPHAFYRDLLGLDRERFRALSLPSPFPREHRRVVIDTRVGTTWKERQDNYGPIALRLAQFARAVDGNCMVLFPSYEFLRQVADRLPATGRRVLIQTRTDDEEARTKILDTLRSALLGDVLLLAVAGGVFAEGVDYPGDMLKAVAVVGPCLPAVSLERQLLKDYYQQRFERGFEYAFVVPGMTRVVQAAGRLIRSAGDRGVIALLDHRFLRPPYRGHLPADWLDDGEAPALAGDPAVAAAEFFAAETLDTPEA